MLPNGQGLYEMSKRSEAFSIHALPWAARRLANDALWPMPNLYQPPVQMCVARCQVLFRRVDFIGITSVSAYQSQATGPSRHFNLRLRTSYHLGLSASTRCTSEGPHNSALGMA